MRNPAQKVIVRDSLSNWDLIMVWDCPGFALLGVFIKDVAVGRESLPNKLSDKAGLSETFDCVTDKMTFINEHKKLEKWSEKYCIQFWKGSLSFCSLRPE